MNRRSILIVATVLATATAPAAFAQAVVHPHPTLGVLAGANFASLSGNDIGDVSNRTGFIGGAYATFHLAKGFGIEPEVLYSMQGVKSNDGNFTMKLDYIQVPVLARYDFATGSPARPFLVAGPTFSFKIKCKLTDGSDSADCKDAPDLEPKSFDMGGAVGAGVAFKVGKEELSVGARYTMGFSKLIDNADSKNKVISVLAGFSF